MPLGEPDLTALKPVTAYIGLGANLGDPARQVTEAVARLRELPEVEVLKTSRLYRTPPLGPPGQPWYVNAVVQVRTRLTPEELMRQLLLIERQMGRERGERWGPRVIDLDLLLYDGEVSSGPELTVPHPEMHRRAFVLVPLAEIAPEAWHPGLNRTVRELLAELAPAEVEAVTPLKAAGG